MTTVKPDRKQYVPIAERDPSSVRAIILARSSSPSAKAEDMTSQVERAPLHRTDGLAAGRGRLRLL